MDNMECEMRYIINSDIDLQGKIMQIPDGCTLVFKKGIIKNGTIIGQNTKIRYNGNCFENIDIKGSWIVPVIKSSMFRDFSGKDIQSIANLQNPHIINEIYIDKGNYWLESASKRDVLSLTSNTLLYLDGNLFLLPQTNLNFSNGYYIISIKDAQNVKIKGNGVVKGDQMETKINSEYGHGIFIYNSRGIEISGITISDVNGDGIDVGFGAKDVYIHDVCIDNYRRNGISITDGDNIKIDHIRVSNGGKTSPFAAIDVEPNDGCSVSSVHVKDMKVENCRVAISGYAKEGSKVCDVTYSNISISGAIKECIISSCFQSISFKNVEIANIDKAAAIMRLIGNKQVVFEDLKVDVPDNVAKYPFYLNNEYLTMRHSVLTCPQLFSWHFSNAILEDCKFKFKSFVWTAKNISSSNLTFNRCVFDGPLMMRPQNVVIRNSVFRRNKDMLYVVDFQESDNFNVEKTGVIFENNKLEADIPEKSNLFRCNVRNSIVTDFH